MNSPQKSEQQKVFVLFLCLLIVYLYKEMVWDPYFHPKLPPAPVTQVAPAEVKPQGAPGDTFAEPAPQTFSATEQQTNPAAPTPSTAPVAAPAAGTSRYPTDKQIKDAGELVIDTRDVQVRLSKLGGRITSFLLKHYAANSEANSPRLNMVDHVEYAPYPLGVYSGADSDAWVQYELRSPQVLLTSDTGPFNAVEGSTASTVILEGVLPDGRGVKKSITVEGSGYFVDVNVALTTPAPDSSRLSVEWTKLITKDSATLLDPYKISGYVWFDGQKALRESFANLVGEQHELSNIIWVSVADKYFMTSLISQDGPVAAKTMKTGELYRARMSGSAMEKHLRMFVGPKNYRLLDSVGHDLIRNIDLGKTAIIAAPLLVVLHYLYDILGNFGLAIVVLTILVKFATYPLTASSFKQMKAMQDLAPEMKRIRETITDRQQQQLQTMQLYKEKGVNPVGGCLPMLLQMPIFIGLYTAILSDIELRHAPFALWIHDLSGPEKLHVFGFGVPVMVLLFVLSMLVQQWMTPSAVDPAQKKAMMVMPLVFGVLFAGMPAGLTLYWLTNNLISIGQQTGFRKGGSNVSALKLTALIAMGVFLTAFVLTKLG